VPGTHGKPRGTAIERGRLVGEAPSRHAVRLLGGRGVLGRLSALVRSGRVLARVLTGRQLLGRSVAGRRLPRVPRLGRISRWRVPRLLRIPLLGRVARLLRIPLLRRVARLLRVTLLGWVPGVARRRARIAGRGCVGLLLVARLLGISALSRCRTVATGLLRVLWPVGAVVIPMWTASLRRIVFTRSIDHEISSQTPVGLPPASWSPKQRRRTRRKATGPFGWARQPTSVLRPVLFPVCFLWSPGSITTFPQPECKYEKSRGS
jgi:hypothetical protein